MSYAFPSKCINSLRFDGDLFTCKLNKCSFCIEPKDCDYYNDGAKSYIRVSCCDCSRVFDITINNSKVYKVTGNPKHIGSRHCPFCDAKVDLYLSIGCYKHE